MTGNRDDDWRGVLPAAKLPLRLPHVRHQIVGTLPTRLSC